MSTVSFSVLVNGDPVGPTILSRGLRQGDNLSPYLFLLCTKGLTSLLKAAELDNNVPGIRICRGTPQVNHMLFADDSVAFCKADIHTSNNLQTLPSNYEKVSGQKINMSKTSMVFSSNVSSKVQSQIFQMWGVERVEQYEKYLGLPPMVGRSKT